MKTRPYCLSIAGFDPSGGAGILADIKTFESNKVIGMGIVTALTFQNDNEFSGVKWIETDEIIKQIEILTKRFSFQFVKIGMLKDLETLEEIISFCKLSIVNCQLIWDPILKTSSGFEIHKEFEKEKLISILKKIFLVTPNTDEIKILTGEKDEQKAAKILSQYCNVFLKGGHSEEKKARDYLFPSPPLQGDREGLYPFRAKKISSFPKHGSGCVLSAAITANLAKGETLHRACLKAKNYVTEFLWSNKTLLGYHRH